MRAVGWTTSLLLCALALPSGAPPSAPSSGKLVSGDASGAEHVGTAMAAGVGAWTRPGEPRRVILVIADGAGTTHWSVLRVAGGSLTLERFPVVGLVDTRSTSPRLVDSAAGASALATGVRTFYRAVAVGPDSLPRQTVLEAAEAAGMATGLVTTTAVTDATPASFAAHQVSRDSQAEIAVQLAASGVDVLMGDGRGWFDGSLREDGWDLLPGLRETHAVVGTPWELAELDLAGVPGLVALFGASTLPARDPAKPRLAEMARSALAVLDRDPDGFFLLLESEATDEAAHANAPLEVLLEALQDVDEALEVVLEYRERHPETLVIVTSDHETGGPSLLTARGNLHSVEYGTTGHTASLVPLFAIGPGAERFAGVRDNDAVGRLLREVTVEDGGGGPDGGGR